MGRQNSATTMDNSTTVSQKNKIKYCIKYLAIPFLDIELKQGLKKCLHTFFFTAAYPEAILVSNNQNIKATQTPLKR